VTSAASGYRRGVLVTATFVACIPWLIAAPFPALFPATAILAVAFARLMGSARISLVLGAGSFVSLVLLAVLVAHSPTGPILSDAPQTGNPFAEVAWGAYVNATSLPVRAWHLAGKIPTLLGFIVLLASLAGEAGSIWKSQPARQSREAVVTAAPVSA
jgi:hypothetical protein